MRTILWAAILLCLAFAGGASAGQGPDSLTHLARTIEPAPEELRWQQIPWLLDLAEGQQVAQREQRPIFLWVTGDDPLERC